MDEHPLRERKAFLEATEALLNKGDHLTILSLAESRLKRMPGDMDARIAIARVWIEQGRFEEAAEMLGEMEKHLASLSPGTPTAREMSRVEAASRHPATDDGAIAEAAEAGRVPDHLQTVTLAELYIRQGHFRMAEEILAAILGKGPHHPRAAELFREVREKIAAQEIPEAKSAPEPPQEVRELRDETADRQEPGGKHAPVIAELSRWLNNIGRLGSHAA